MAGNSYGPDFACGNAENITTATATAAVAEFYEDADAVCRGYPSHAQTEGGCAARSVHARILDDRGFCDAGATLAGSEWKTFAKQEIADRADPVPSPHRRGCDMKACFAMPLAFLLLGGSAGAASAEEATYSVGLGTVENPPESQTEFAAAADNVIATALVTAPVSVPVQGNFVFEFDPSTPDDDVTIVSGRVESDPSGENVLHFNAGGMPGGFPSRANRFDLLIADQLATSVPFTVDVPDRTAEELGFALVLLGTEPAPDESQTAFAPDTPEIVLTAVRFMPTGTRVSSVMTYVEGPDEGVGSTLTTEDFVFEKPADSGMPSNVVTMRYSKPTAGWPTGTSRIDVLVNGAVTNSIDFTVE